MPDELNEWGDPPLTRQEKKELTSALNEITDTPSNKAALFALFMLFIYPLIWVLIAHFAFHF